ncbi:hypothetical protein A2Y85_05845 [candidate division WOR-3 bacterium RBG_13_43_14]|uniref:Lipid A biosynthesis acyltransferase n=1 Tax=candidate division WOR-3 bacterium RBG_13_43_14 TaxID=1802590 RepID=A0A1F4U989_UNCW3|nr:MAG: hypothetical protein A2Y85_05845 [candidate division WOR-3 bacterium RBG_13_43_14]
MNIVVVLQRLGIIASTLAPRKFADTIARIIGLAFYFLSPKSRSYILDNLYHILRNDPRYDRRKEITKLTFINFALSMVDFFRLSYLSRDDFEVHCQGLEHIDGALALHRGCVLISLHIGNWDYGGAYLASRGVPIMALVQETDPTMFLLYTKHRERTGMKTYPVSKAPYAFIETIKKNKVLALLADRNVYGPGKMVEFLNGVRRIPRGLSDIIVKHNIPVVLCYVIMQKHGKRYGLFIQPVSYDRLDAESLEKKIIKVFEKIIRQYPDQWFVFHPEWIEDEGIHEKTKAFAENYN